MSFMDRKGRGNTPTRLLPGFRCVQWNEKKEPDWETSLEIKQTLA